METIRLGTTDLQVSRVGFGGIPIQRLQTDVIDIWQFHGVSTPEARCPYQLPIREMLVEQVALYDSLVP